MVVFLGLVSLVWLGLVAPALPGAVKVFGMPAWAGWLAAGLCGHDNVAEEVSPGASWALAQGEARAASGWHAALVWAAAHPGPVLAGVAGLAAVAFLPDLASLGAIVLVRGLPGSGKSTWAAGQAGDIRLDGGQARVVSADDWFTVRDPRGPVAYLFDPAQLPQAHADCLRQAKAGHAAGEIVFVTNTFTQEWEMRPYLDLGATVAVCPPVPGRLGVHGVPQAAWDRMAARWEDHPGETILPPQV